MWRIAIYATIFYLIMVLITKIFEKRKVKKYGRNIEIDRTDGNDSGSNNGTGDAGTDKQ